MGKSRKKLKRKLAKLLEAFDSSSSSSSSDDLWETASLSLAVVLHHATGSGFSANRDNATEPAENRGTTTLLVQSASSHTSQAATSSMASLTRCGVCLCLSYCLATYKTFVGLIKQTKVCICFSFKANSKIMFWFSLTNHAHSPGHLLTWMLFFWQLLKLGWPQVHCIISSM